MKVKDVLRDLGPTTLVQIYKPVRNKYDTILYKAYTVSAILDPKNEVWLGKYFDKEIDHAEFEHHYTTDDMIASCNIYLKAYPVKTGLMSTYGVFAKEKPSTTTIDYSDLEKKWGRFCKQFNVEGHDAIQAWHINVFFDMLNHNELEEMENKDLS